jgi:hypothetical protein
VKGTTFDHMGPLPEIAPAVNPLHLEKRKAGTGTRPWVEDLAGLLGAQRGSDLARACCDRVKSLSGAARLAAEFPLSPVGVPRHLRFRGALITRGSAQWGFIAAVGRGRAKLVSNPEIDDLCVRGCRIAVPRSCETSDGN